MAKVTYRDVVRFIEYDATDDEIISILDEINGVYVESKYRLPVETVQDELKFELIAKHFKDISVEDLEHFFNNLNK